MYATQTKILDARYGGDVEVKHLVLYTRAGFQIVSLCGAEFYSGEITMFGDADLCATCADICKNLPRYVR
jgi:hypothetical protein